MFDITKLPPMWSFFGCQNLIPGVLVEGGPRAGAGCRGSCFQVRAFFLQQYIFSSKYEMRLKWDILIFHKFSSTIHLSLKKQQVLRNIIKGTFIENLTSQLITFRCTSLRSIMLKIISSDWRLSVVSLTRRWQNVQVIIILENIMMVSLTIKSHVIYDADSLHFEGLDFEDRRSSAFWQRSLSMPGHHFVSSNSSLATVFLKPCFIKIRVLISKRRITMQVNTEPTISRSIKLIVRPGADGGMRPPEKVSGDYLILRQDHFK